MATATKKRGTRKTSARKTQATSTPKRVSDKLTCRQVVTQVLQAADTPMTVSEVVAAVLARKDHRVGGKTPAATIGAELYVGAKPENGRYVKTARGTFSIAEAAGSS